MGQKPSHHMGGRYKTKLPLFTLFSKHATLNPNPEQPIKFQYKTRRKVSNKVKKTTNINNNNNNNNTTVKQQQQQQNQQSSTTNNNIQTFNNFNQNCSNNLNNNNSSSKNTNSYTNTNNTKFNKENSSCQIVKTHHHLLKEVQRPPIRTKSEPNLVQEKNRHHKHRRKTQKTKSSFSQIQQFGYEIDDIDSFLTKATIEKPANIPVVLAFPSVLYQTRIGGYQAEIFLPLGMVVNAIFKNDHWLYVQTPHAEEGYVSYAACLPLGIIPPAEDDETGPCWEKSTDIFPKPSGNITDTEKLSSKSECSTTLIRNRKTRNSNCGEQSVDGLYLKATASRFSNNSMGIRHTLLVITKNYNGMEKNAMNVKEGDVVFLLNSSVQGWFWVQSKEGREGFIPAAVAGHGFL